MLITASRGKFEMVIRNNRWSWALLGQSIGHIPQRLLPPQFENHCEADFLESVSASTAIGESIGIRVELVAIRGS